MRRNSFQKSRINNYILKKTTTTTSSSMESINHGTTFATAAVPPPPKKYKPGEAAPHHHHHHLRIEFPTSPQTTNTKLQEEEEEEEEEDDHQKKEEEEEIVHQSHRHHSLAPITLPALFTCAGCKEYGAGRRFACQQCEFQLHDFCALSPPVLKLHPFHGQHQLVFHPKSKPGGIMKGGGRCDVCGKGTRGFTFRCGACSFQMHPCCALLSPEIIFPGHHPHHSLRLLPAVSTPSSSSGNGGILDHHQPPAPGNNAFSCGECKRKRSGRVYRCTVCDYHLHAVCAKPMVNGLRANGIDPPPDKPNMLGTAARVATHVVVGFIGGIIDGIGQEFGELLVQSIARGRCTSTTTRRRTTRR